MESGVEFHRAGDPVQTVENYVAGGSNGTNNDQNRTTWLFRDILGHVTFNGVVLPRSDPREYADEWVGTMTTCDLLERPINQADQQGTSIATAYTPAGRVAEVSRPYPTAQQPSTWTCTIYDLAGRPTTSLTNCDASKVLQYADFEDGNAGWVTGGTATRARCCNTRISRTATPAG